MNISGNHISHDDDIDLKLDMKNDEIDYAKNENINIDGELDDIPMHLQLELIASLSENKVCHF